MDRYKSNNSSSSSARTLAECNYIPKIARRSYGCYCCCYICIFIFRKIEIKGKFKQQNFFKYDDDEDDGYSSSESNNSLEKDDDEENE